MTPPETTAAGPTASERGERSVRQQLRDFGVPLGISADASYEGGSARLGPGDLLVIFTDGLVKAESEEGEEYGESRLLQQLNAVRDGSAADTLRNLMAGVHAFVARARQHDDVTCLVFQRAAR